MGTGSDADVLTITERALVCSGSFCRGETPPVKYALKSFTPDPDVPEDMLDMQLSRKDELGAERDCKGTIRRKNGGIFHMFIACAGSGTPDVDQDYWAPR
jgi:hypothetical protein